MSDVLFISREDILRYTSIGGNVDIDKLLPHIKVAQDINIMPILGTKLYEKLQSVIEGNQFSGVYYDLLVDFVQPVLVHFAMAEFVQFHSYQIGNAGVFRRITDTSTTPDKAEIDALVMKARDNAMHYRARLISHLCYYSSRYPEYNAAQEDGESPNTQTNINRFVI